MLPKDVALVAYERWNACRHLVYRHTRYFCASHAAIVAATRWMVNSIATITPWRPVGSAELRLIVEADYREFPPRLPEQPICYPVLNEAYAVQIAKDWNVNADGAGYVTRFEVRQDFLATEPDVRGLLRRADVPKVGWGW